MPDILDGRKLAEALNLDLAARCHLLRAAGVTPTLAVVQVGSDPAAETYIRSKKKLATRLGVTIQLRKMDASATTAEIVTEIHQLNHDRAIHAIFVELPLPPTVNTRQVLDAVLPSKDADGVTSYHLGRLFSGEPSMIPCTANACMKLLRQWGGSLEGADVVVLGRSLQVGRPVSQLLMAANATVTVMHSKSRHVAERCQAADVVVAAVGRAEMVRGDWIKPGAVVIDVGINRVPNPGRSARLIGDVAFAEAVNVAKAITPVPGGVGPVTVSCLMENVITLAATPKI